MKKIEIEYETIQVPKVIKIDDKIYPNHMRNWKVVKEYEETKDESVLDRLIDVSLQF